MKLPLFGGIENKQMQLSKFGIIIDRIWKSLPKFYSNVELDEWVVMPDHVHGIVVIHSEGMNQSRLVEPIHELALPMRGRIKIKQTIQMNRRMMLIPKIIGRFKMQTSKQINILRNTPGGSIWQSDYFERLIRTEQELHNVRNYIQQNPANWRKY